jgi:hypothetical protein
VTLTRTTRSPSPNPCDTEREPVAKLPTIHHCYRSVGMNWYMIRNGTDSFPRSIPALATHPTRGTSTPRLRLCYEPPHPSNLTPELPTSFLAFSQIYPGWIRGCSHGISSGPVSSSIYSRCSSCRFSPIQRRHNTSIFPEFSVLYYSVRKKTQGSRMARFLLLIIRIGGDLWYRVQDNSFPPSSKRNSPASC